MRSTKTPLEGDYLQCLLMLLLFALAQVNSKSKSPHQIPRLTTRVLFAEWPRGPSSLRQLPEEQASKPGLGKVACK